MQKNKIIIIILTIFLIVAISADIYLVFHTSNKPNGTYESENTNTSENSSENDLMIIKKVKCTKNEQIKEAKMSYDSYKIYSFSVAKNQKLFSYLDETTYSFANIEDLNSFYKDLEITISNMKNKTAKLSKNETDLTIYFSLIERWGDYEYYKDDYINLLEDSFGYTCEIQNL